MSPVDPLLGLGLGATFAVSAVPKLRSPDQFIMTVFRYRILPESVARLVGVLLPPVELITGLLLLSGLAARLGAAIAATLLVGFAAGIGINLARGRRFDCGCFGLHGSRSIGPRVLLVDILLLAAAMALAASGGSWAAPERWSPFSMYIPTSATGSPPWWSGVVIVVGAGIGSRFALARRGHTRQHRQAEVQGTDSRASNTPATKLAEN